MLGISTDKQGSGLLPKVSSFLSAEALEMDENLSVMGKRSSSFQVQDHTNDRIFQLRSIRKVARSRPPSSKDREGERRYHYPLTGSVSSVL